MKPNEGSKCSEGRASEDILALDKTIFFQLIIFVVAILVFNSLLFKPLLGLSERRRKLTIGARG